MQVLLKVTCTTSKVASIELVPPSWDINKHVAEKHQFRFLITGNLAIFKTGMQKKVLVVLCYFYTQFDITENTYNF